MKEAFSSEYERCDLRANSTKKGVMQVADTQLLRTFVRGGSVLAVFASNTKVSSQCLTLGSRYKNICKLCNGQQILGAYNVHYEKTGFQCRSTGMIPILHSSINYWCHSSNSLPVIPVRDTGIQPLTANKQVYRFDSHKNSRFHAKNNVHYEKTGFQCRSTGMTPILHSKLQRSYNCVSGHWNDTLLVAQCSYSCVSVTFMTSGEL